MNCIVTAGPSYEPLDNVRRLTNFSTGRLGSELANFLAGKGHEVTLFLGEQATWRMPIKASVQSFSTTMDLRDRLEMAAKGEVHVVLHAAAVSDFGFGKVWQRTAEEKLVAVESGKVPTDLKDLLVELAPTPKIISELRMWYPEAIIIGWKFEVDGNREGAVAKAREQISENKTNACVANGPAYGKGFGLVTPSTVLHAASREELFGMLEAMLKAEYAMKEPEAADESDDDRKSGNPAGEESGVLAEAPDERKDDGGDGDLAEFDTKVEGEKRDSDAAAVAPDAEFAQHAGETEAVNQPEAESK